MGVYKEEMHRFEDLMATEDRIFVCEEDIAADSGVIIRRQNGFYDKKLKENWKKFVAESVKSGILHKVEKRGNAKHGEYTSTVTFAYPFEHDDENPGNIVYFVCSVTFSRTQRFNPETRGTREWIEYFSATERRMSMNDTDLSAAGFKIKR